MTPSCVGCHVPLGGQHKPSCYRQGLVSEESLLPAPLMSGPGDTQDLAGVLGLTDSAERPIRCGTFSEPATSIEKLRYVLELRARIGELSASLDEVRRQRGEWEEKYNKSAPDLLALGRENRELRCELVKANNISDRYMAAALDTPEVVTERAERYRAISTLLMERYSAAFPNYAWTDEESAVDLMDAEIKTARLERDHLLGGLKKIAALKKPHPKNRDAHEAVRLAVEYLEFGTVVPRFEPPSYLTPQPLSKAASMDRLAATMDRKTAEIEAAGLCQWGYCTVASDLDRVWADIRQCRANQDEQWGGPEHDDTHAAQEWLGYIQKQLDEADIALDPPPGGSNLDIYEYRLIDVAALAVAAIQSNRRKRNA